MMNFDENCEICQRLPGSEWMVFETKYWKVTLGHEQLYLGRSYVALKRHIDDLANLTVDEWSDFRQVVTRYEDLLRDVFGATLFNWSCLMNNAYQSHPYNAHVHWHAKPRYDHSVKVAGQTFIDQEFGQHYDRIAEQGSVVSDEIRQAIYNQLMADNHV